MNTVDYQKMTPALAYTSTHTCTYMHRLQISLYQFKICLVLLVYLYQEHKNLAINSTFFLSSYVFIFLPSFFSFFFFLPSFLLPYLLPSISSFLPPFFSFFLSSNTYILTQPCRHTCKWMSEEKQFGVSAEGRGYVCGFACIICLSSICLFIYGFHISTWPL